MGTDGFEGGPEVPEAVHGVSRRQLLQRGAGATGALFGTGALASWVAACGGSGTSATTGGGAAELTQGGLLKASLRSQPDTLDPAKSPLSSAFEVFTNINGSLVNMDPEGKIVPGVALKWEQPEPRTYVFDLRPDATFHNGDPVDAKAVKFSFERILNEKTASPWASNLGAVDKIEVTGPRQVALHLKQPYAPLLTILARNAQIVSPRAIASGDPARKPVGCGPFEFVEWVQGDHITLRRFDGYFEKGLPHLDEVRLTFAAPSPGTVQALRSKEVNYLSSLPANMIGSLKDDSAFNFTTSTTSGFPRMLAFNTSKAPLDDLKLRQAIAYAVDREAVHKVAYFSAGEVGSQELGSGSQWYSDNDPYAGGPDLDRAKQLIAETGLATPIRIEYMSTAADPSFGRIGEVVRDQLKPLGIELEVNVLEPSVWLQRLLEHDYEMTGIFNETVSDPDQMYSLMVLSDAGLNVFEYKNPDCDRLIEQARAESDVAKRKELYAQVREIVFEDVPLFYIHYDTPAYLSNADVEGVTTRPTLELALQTVGFEKE